MKKTKIITIRLNPQDFELLEDTLKKVNEKSFVRINQQIFIEGAIKDFCHKVLEQGLDLITM